MKRSVMSFPSRRLNALHIIFALCTGFQSMLESNSNFVLFVFGAITSTGPVYLSDLLKIYTPSRQLRSSADIRILCIPPVNTKSYGERSFSYTGPTLWNTLPKDIRFSQSASFFRSAQKIQQKDIVLID